jgi:hypothetical protein
LRTATINVSLERRISTARLRKYLAEEKGNLHRALALYELNTRLCEAFYTALQCLEITLRNTIHEEMSINYGDKWLMNGLVPFSPLSKSMIDEAINELEGGGHPADVDDVVAELKFAFWIGLLNAGYDNTIWRKALYRGFRIGGARKRHVVQGRLNAIRRLRNRIAHHEPIFHRDTLQDHAELLDAIGWMCADTCAWATHHSRVPAVFAVGTGE